MDGVDSVTTNLNTVEATRAGSNPAARTKHMVVHVFSLPPRQS